MQYNDIVELSERGWPITFGEQLTAGAMNHLLKDRNAVALVMLHAAAMNYPLDVPRCVKSAFELADAYMKKVNEPDPVRRADQTEERVVEQQEDKLKKILAVLAEWDCPVCGWPRGSHDGTCALGAAIEG